MPFDLASELDHLSESLRIDAKLQAEFSKLPLTRSGALAMRRLLLGRAEHLVLLAEALPAD
jgi:hypothetical protein